MNRTLSLACAAICLLGYGATLCAQSDQPSLADVARQKSAAHAKRVVTNDEIPPSPEANNPPSSPANPAKTDKANAPAADKDATARDAAANPAAPSDPQARLQQLTQDNENLQRVIKKLQEKIDSTEDRGLIGTLGEVVMHAKAEIAANQAQIEKLKATGAAAGQTAGNPPPPITPPLPNRL